MAFRTIAGPAGALNVDDGGDGSRHVVVFVHSFAGSSKHWTAQLDFLRENRRAIAIDLRGHGQSEAPRDNDYAIGALCQDVEAVLDGLKLDDVILVGHSMGGSASIAFASAHPERVTGLLLAGTPGRTAAAQSEAILAAMKADFDKVTEKYWNDLLKGAQPETLARVRADMQKIPRAAAERMIAAVFAFDPVKAMRNYPGPCLVVNTPHADTPDALEKQVPDLPFESMTGTSHWMQMDKPGEFNEILSDFIAEVEAAEGVQPGWHSGAQWPQDYRREY